MKLLTEPQSSAKWAHGKDFGWLDYGMYLAPATESGREMCSHRTATCTELCLFTAGRAAHFANINEARIRKTRLWWEDRAEFARLLHADLRRVLAKHLSGQPCAVRLNGTSDLPWERLRIFDGLSPMDAFPQLTWYDYTKNPTRMTAKLPANYHLTFSLSEDNEADAVEVLRRGHNVAVVFDTRRGQQLPASYLGVPVIDGDIHDLRFLDPRPVVVGLRAKGQAVGLTNGFVRSGATTSQEVAA